MYFLFPRSLYFFLVAWLSIYTYHQLILILSTRAENAYCGQTPHVICLFNLFLGVFPKDISILPWQSRLTVFYASGYLSLWSFPLSSFWEFLMSPSRISSLSFLFHTFLFLIFLINFHWTFFHIFLKSTDSNSLEASSQETHLSPV